jgi:5S rRNA maturation endonuclease (ribonuclease M5)
LTSRDKRYLDFIEFLVAFVDELNDLASQGAAVLVEGQRDRRALVDLGYQGRILTRASVSASRVDESLRGVGSVVILTDMDREGRRLTASYTKLFQSLRLRASLAHRRRLSRASHGVFLHIENLARFAPEVRDIRGMTR